jgi:hypothetical protein
MRDKWALLMAKKATRRRGGSDIEENEWNKAFSLALPSPYNIKGLPPSHGRARAKET